MIVAVAFKVWLALAQTRPADATAAHDDALFVRLAASVLRGDWLGAYDQLTLVKGPIYPLWLALCNVVGLPSYVLQQLLFAAACWAVVWSLRHWISERFRFVLFLALLFNPISTALPALTFKREGVYISWTLLLVAALIGIVSTTRKAAVHCPDSVASRWRYSLLLGAVLATFWLTREEGLWIVPAVLVLLAFAIWRQLRSLRSIAEGVNGAGGRARALQPYIVAAAVALGLVLCVACLNRIYYGVFTLNELKSRSFASAYGALLGANPQPGPRYLPVPSSVRESLYDVSPSLAQLRGELEGSATKRWAVHGRRLLPRAMRGQEIAGGWFLWAFRDAAQGAGFHRDARTARDFYAAVGREIRAADSRGEITLRSTRSTIRPSFRRADVRPMASAMKKAWWVIAGFRGAGPLVGRLSVGDERALQRFRDLTGDRIAPTAAAGPGLHQEATSQRARILLLKVLHRLYGILGPLLFVLGVVAWVSAAPRQLRRGLEGPWVIWLGLVGSVTLLALAVSFIHVSSFPGVNAKYLSGAVALCPLLALLPLSQLRRRSEASGSA